MSEPQRQAVLLIHGIGEQRPMSTLREFVSSLVGKDKDFRSKPDNVSRSFELRRLTYDETKDEQKYQTCFFECYWAYRFRDTSYRNVLEWGRRLVFTNPCNVPLWGLIWWLFWIAAIIVVLCICTAYLISKIGILSIPIIKELVQSALVAVSWIEAIEARKKIILLVLSAPIEWLSYVFLYQLGDAARYLDSLPANIVERQAIRTQGVNLPRKLHSAKNKDGKPKYARIIVIGHSLGSVIDYDILKFYWANVNDKLIISNACAETALKTLKDYR